MAIPITSIAANTVSNDAASIHAAPHRKNAARRNPSDSPYQQRTTQRDNPTQVLIKQAVDYLIEQLEAGHSETLAAYLGTMARFHNHSFYVKHNIKSCTSGNAPLRRETLSARRCVRLPTAQ